MKWHQCILVLRWCFALKGQCHKIFCFRFFFMNHFSTSLWNYHQDHFKCLKKFWRYSHVKVHHLYQWNWRYRCCCCFFRGEPSGNKFRNLVHQTAIPQICGLTKFVIFADLPHVWQFANLQFVDPIFVAICWSIFFCELETTANPQIHFFLLTNTYLKCSNSKFYQIKNSSKQTCWRLLDNFAIKKWNF